MKNLLFFLVLLFAFPVFAQEETGMWSSISVDKKLNKKWTVGAETELRTFGGTDKNTYNDMYFVRLIDRWSFSVNTAYSPIKPVKISATYIIMNKLDTKYIGTDFSDTEYSHYQWRHRVYFSVSGKQKWGNFSFSLRERLQFTTKDDSKRPKPYDVKNDFTWRNRLQVSYNINKFPVTPAASVESFYSLNNPAGNKFETLRYILSFTYKINKRNSFELYGVYNQDLSKENIYGLYILGLSYQIDL